jgi:hypothetical protein
MQQCSPMGAQRIFHPPLPTVAFLVMALFLHCPQSGAQQNPTSSASPDRLDRNAFRTLFRQSMTYEKLADEAEASHDPKPYFRRLLAARFQLSDDDNANLKRLSLAYQGEIDPIHTRVVEIITRFHARFPTGVIGPGEDPNPPTELKILEQQEDAVTLQYRDLLRNSMKEEAFKKLHATILESFGKPL